jgi:ABC-type uncharacterized transport system fused permease/ATPase subunit
VWVVCLCPSAWRLLTTNKHMNLPHPHPTIFKTTPIQVREGEYRFVSQRLVTHAEEVAFYDGIRRERGIIQQAFARLLGTFGYLRVMWCGVVWCGVVWCGVGKVCVLTPAPYW